MQILLWLLPALGLALLLRRLWAGYPRAAGHRVLAAREAAFLAAAADALYPAGGAIAPSGTAAGIPAYTDRYLQAVPAGTRLLMRLLFLLVEQSPLLWPAPGAGGRRRFSALSPEQRVAVLEGWRTSGWFPRRLVFTSLRAILTMGYFAHPAVLRALRLAPYAIETPVTPMDCWVPRVGADPASIPFREADVTVHGPTDRPPAGTPLDLAGPLRPDYAEPRS